MDKNKLGKAKVSINKLDANKSSSGVSDTEMSVMYNLSNMTYDIENDPLGGKSKSKNKLADNQVPIKASNSDMASMYDMLKNK